MGRKEIRDLLLEERRRGVTIFINSHLLGEVEQLCDRVAILRKGQLIVTGTVPELTGQKASWIVGFDRDLPATFRFSGASLEPADGACLRLLIDVSQGSADPDQTLDRFVAAAGAAGVRLRHLERERATLEDLYLRIAGGEGPR